MLPSLDCPLPDEDITGLTTQGKPISAAPAIIPSHRF
jgi:hypothetical protein